MLTARITALTALALAACVPSLLVGDKGQDDTADASTGDDPTTTDSDEPSTTGVPNASVCGDGIVGPDEVCDDGNDEPNDGCDAACARTGAVAWTREFSGRLDDLKVGADGTIVACGMGLSEPFVMAFAPDGTELWSEVPKSSGELAVDALGRVFVSHPAGVQAFAPGGAALWEWQAPPPDNNGVGETTVGLVATGDALYTGRAVAYDDLARLIVRRHDIDAGGEVWAFVSPDNRKIYPRGIAAVGDQVVVAGRSSDDQNLDWHPMLAVFNGDGTLSLHLDNPMNRSWFSVAAIGDGELVMSGKGPDDAGVVVQRLGADHEVLWTTVAEGAANGAGDHVAAGPGGRSAIVGYDIKSASVRAYDGAGASLWTSKFVIEKDNQHGGAEGVAYGPDFLAVGGTLRTVDEDSGLVLEEKWWLRRFALD